MTKLNDRVKFADHIMETVDAIMNGNEAIYIKGEHFGCWANRVVKRFIRDPQAHGHSFNSISFAEAKSKRLSATSDSTAALIDNTNPIAGACELNYAISAVYLGVLGDAAGIDEAKYGFRTYLKSMLGKIYESVDSVSTGSQRDVTMSFRRHLIARGVVLDVIDGVSTSLGCIWDSQGKLILPTEEEAS